MSNNIFNKSIIAACETKNLKEAVKSSSSAIIHMNADINTIVSKQYKDLTKEKSILIHFDLLKGLSNDKEALVFLKKYVNPFGIVTTKSNIVRSAKKDGLFTIQRIFLIDTQSFNNSISAINENKPDAIEIMPALAPSIVKRYKEKVDLPIILGGLITEESQIDEAFQYSADAVSLSNMSLWNYSYI